jgi:ferrous iron transport protein A
VTELSQLRPLSVVPAGQMVKLVAIDAGHGLRSRLLAMGLVPNVRITVVSNNHPGPFVLSVKGTKMVLGRGMAHKIMVT